MFILVQYRSNPLLQFFSDLEQCCPHTFIHFDSVFNLQNRTRQYLCMNYIDIACMHKFLKKSTRFLKFLYNPTCAIFSQYWGFKDIKYDTLHCTLYNHIAQSHCTITLHIVHFILHIAHFSAFRQHFFASLFYFLGLLYGAYRCPMGGSRISNMTPCIAHCTITLHSHIVQSHCTLCISYCTLHISLHFDSISLHLCFIF